MSTTTCTTTRTTACPTIRPAIRPASRTAPTASHEGVPGDGPVALAPLPRGVAGRRRAVRAEAGAASAEYAAVTACGVGLAGVLLKLLTSDFGQSILRRVFEALLAMVGIG